MHLLTRFTLVAFIFSLLLLAVPQEADAQADISLGPRVGIDVGDIEEAFIGADVRIESPALPVIINPTFDFYFTDDPLTFWGLSVNALYPFGVDNEVFTPYAGGGLGIFQFSLDDQEVETPFGSATIEGDSSTEIGLNLIFGAEFITGGPVTPFAEAHFSPVFTEGETTTLFGIRGGILFGI
jgi:hypothetical protein